MEDFGLEAGEGLGGKQAVGFCSDSSEGFEGGGMGVFISELAGQDLVRGSFEGFDGGGLLGCRWRDVS
jgi:hypothetical protein